LDGIPASAGNGICITVAVVFVGNFVSVGILVGVFPIEPHAVFEAISVKVVKFVLLNTVGNAYA
jgi:hypothetical protein